MKQIKFVIFTLVFLFLLSAGYFGWRYYQDIFAPNITLKDGDSTIFFIHTGSDMETVFNHLDSLGLVKNMEGLRWVAERKNFSSHIYPGRYRLFDNMNSNDIIDLFRSGKQEPLNVVLNNIQTVEELAGKASKYIEADSISIYQLLTDSNICRDYGMTTNTILSLFIPNTYEFYWNTSAHQFIERMHEEYQKFWTASRIAKADKVGLSITEVSILASIVQLETTKKEESQRIAGVYINRLNKNMLLQADPTVKYAVGDFSIKRVLNKHKEIDSPYNTYIYTGLPPGPICLPDIHFIDAVLDYEKHNYLFFCAREDFSGYSNFAVTYKEHLLNAKRYQAALNRKKIYR